MTPPKPVSTPTDAGRRFALEGFMVDFFGGLLPGIVFLLSCAAALTAPLVRLRAVLSGAAPQSFVNTATEVLTTTQNTPSALWLIAFTIVAIVAYLVGHLFYRHDVKEADKSSFNRLKKALLRNFEPPPDTKSVEEAKEKMLRSQLGCAVAEDCEFPYPYFADYLTLRQLDHLQFLVPWSGSKNSRTKAYVNILKIRLHHYHPDKCGTITRNEAHVRLASSTWYVAKLLRWVAILGLLVTLLAAGRSAWLQVPAVPFFRGASGNLFTEELTAILMPSTVLFAALYARRTIDGFLHYQRMRELLFVLETAYTAFQGERHLLNPPFKV